MITFCIRNRFKITNRGYALVGDVSDDVVLTGDTIVIGGGDAALELRIAGVGFERGKDNQIGLLVSEADGARLAGMALPLDATIVRP